MKQALLKYSLWIKRYGQNSEQMSFFSINFKAILALSSCDYFQIIVNSLITLVEICQAHHWGRLPKFINGYKMQCL